MPPWPGRRLAESLTPTSLLITDSARSENCDTIDIKRPSTAASLKDIAERINIILKMIAVTIAVAEPPTAPSIVFFGLTIEASGLRPNLWPKYIAPVSSIHITIKRKKESMTKLENLREKFANVHEKFDEFLEQHHELATAAIDEVEKEAGNLYEKFGVHTKIEAAIAYFLEQIHVPGSFAVMASQQVVDRIEAFIQKIFNAKKEAAV